MTSLDQESRVMLYLFFRSFSDVQCWTKIFSTSKLLKKKINMLALGSWPLFLFSLLPLLLHHSPSLAFSLKNCSIIFPETANNLWVTCKARELTAIPDDIPRNATSLDLSSNYVLKIARTDFRCLSKLISVQVQNNLISHIDDGAFADLVIFRVLHGWEILHKIVATRHI